MPKIYSNNTWVAYGRSGKEGTSDGAMSVVVGICLPLYNNPEWKEVCEWPPSLAVCNDRTVGLMKPCFNQKEVEKLK